MSNFNMVIPDRQAYIHIDMAELESMLYEICEYAKAGCEAAIAFMKSDLRTEYVNMELSFNDGKAIAYEGYSRISFNMKNVIRKCKNVKTSLRQEVLS